MGVFCYQIKEQSAHIFILVKEIIMEMKWIEYVYFLKQRESMFHASYQKLIFITSTIITK